MARYAHPEDCEACARGERRAMDRIEAGDVSFRTIVGAMADPALIVRAVIVLVILWLVVVRFSLA